MRVDWSTPVADTPNIFTTTVLRTERLAPNMVRVVLGGAEVAAFPDHGFTDRYVKLIFPRPDRPEGARPDTASDERPILRTYTIRRHDVAAGELTIDFVTHGDAGVAGPWAAAAQRGDQLVMSAPGGAYRPDPTVDHHLLVGDDAALPAIAAALEEMSPDMSATVVAEVDGPADQIDLSSPARVDLRWLHRNGATGPERLLGAVRALELPEGRIQAFVHGELHMTRALRPHLLDERAIPRELLSLSGYWRRGKDEEGFQAEKRELSSADVAAGRT